MHTYKFPVDQLYGIMVHVSGYKDMSVESLTNDGVEYTLGVNIPIHPDEVIHLNENYGLVEVL
jgi:hypothetical protein